ncbi:hypothetical protein SLEP1_g20700 [Rubroshorea leprosula]|uniref:Uncharacterized protein n=1 Tax=Rubroshorea leprosula TaxID=152421 RepID=A0AAV5J8Y7_9ROSI|nr:hypothetical protein SLEP1_g20700 [Rubroshorea leprosula]
MLQLSRPSICCYFGSLNTTTPTLLTPRMHVVDLMGLKKYEQPFYFLWQCKG